MKTKGQHRFPKLLMHVEPLPVVDVRAVGTQSSATQIRPWLLCIRKPVTTTVLHAFLDWLLRCPPSDRIPRVTNEVVDVYFCVAGKITQDAPIQHHRNRFSDTFYVQFAKVEEQACRRSIAEIIEVATCLGPLHAGGFDPYDRQVSPNIPSLVFRGVALQRLMLFTECVSRCLGTRVNCNWIIMSSHSQILLAMRPLDRQAFTSLIELLPNSPTAKIEKIFAQAIIAIRDLWLKLPSTKRRSYRDRKCLSILEVHAFTSFKELLIATVTPSDRGDIPSSLIFDVRLAGESLRGYPRTETYERVDGRTQWTTSFE